MVNLTAKQKAEQLVRLFNDKADNGWFVCEDFSKRCALACVDEIIQAMTKLNEDYANKTYWHPIDWWKEVREEVKKL